MALVTVVVGVLVVVEAAVAGVVVGAADGAARCADGGGCRRLPLLFVGGGMGWETCIQVVAPPVVWFVRVMWASIDGAAFDGVAEVGVGVGASDAGSNVGNVLVVSACGSQSQVANQAMPPVRLVRVVSVTVWLMPLVRAVWLSCQASVALVTLMVMLVSVVLWV